MDQMRDALRRAGLLDSSGRIAASVNKTPLIKKLSREVWKIPVSTVRAGRPTWDEFKAAHAAEAEQIERAFFGLSALDVDETK